MVLAESVDSHAVNACGRTLFASCLYMCLSLDMQPGPDATAVPVPQRQNQWCHVSTAGPRLTAGRT